MDVDDDHGSEASAGPEPPPVPLPLSGLIVDKSPFKEGLQNLATPESPSAPVPKRQKLSFDQLSLAIYNPQDLKLKALDISSHKEKTLPVFSDPLVTIIQILGNKADVSILHNLRQLSSECYETLNSTYWDIINQKIKIAHLYEILYQTYSIYTDENGKKHRTKITADNWDSEIAHTFRSLQFEEGEWEWNSPNWPSNLVLQISPYITTMEIELNRCELSDILKQFPNLINLKLSSKCFTKKEAYEKLFESLRTANPTTKIDINIQDYFIEVYDGLIETFRTVNNLPNVTIFIKMGYMYCPFPYDIFPWTRCLGQLINIAKGYKDSNSMTKLRIHVKQTVSTMSELEILTSVLPQHQEIFESFKLRVLLSTERPSFPNFPNDEKDIVRCLSDLSPLVTKLTITNDEDGATGRSVLDLDSQWPKLTYLNIVGYAHPLKKILQNAPKLQELYLDVDQEQCLYMPPNDEDPDSEKSNLEEIFKNLNELKELKMVCQESDGEKISTGSELEGFLKDKLGLPFCYGIVVPRDQLPKYEDVSGSEETDNADDDDDEEPETNGGEYDADFGLVNGNENNGNGAANDDEVGLVNGNEDNGNGGDEFNFFNLIYGNDNEMSGDELDGLGGPSDSDELDGLGGSSDSDEPGTEE